MHNLNAGKIPLIPVNAAYQGKFQRENISFYFELQDTSDTTEKVDKIILKNLNAHVGKNQNKIERMIGAFLIGNVNSDENFIQFCTVSLTIMNAFLNVEMPTNRDGIDGIHRDDIMWKTQGQV